MMRTGRRCSLAAAMVVVILVVVASSTVEASQGRFGDRWLCGIFSDARHCGRPGSSPAAMDSTSSSDSGCEARHIEWENFASRARFVSASSREEFKKRRLGDCYDWKPEPEEPRACCRALNLFCLSQCAGLSEEEFCEANPGHQVCPAPNRMCCEALNAECNACREGQTVKAYCQYNPSVSGCGEDEPAARPPRPAPKCCKAVTASCMSCALGITEREYCRDNPTTSGCPEPPKKEEPRVCCMAMTASCLSCSEGISKREFCSRYRNKRVQGCSSLRAERPERPERPQRSRSGIGSSLLENLSFLGSPRAVGRKD
uniref:Uncharacterized protein n=2 Tax=Chloropicon primus TaxID=1764295 RepID=A0A7S2T093_9CHLO|mmetsp:Transcript_1882/g.5122  ORF Transcript_1882/g.5122 Transcript_1882/m.5122 type:complete len:315 (+) Transcript_1882:804-1748(+)